MALVYATCLWLPIHSFMLLIDATQYAPYGYFFFELFVVASRWSFSLRLLVVASRWGFSLELLVEAFRRCSSCIEMPLKERTCLIPGTSLELHWNSIGTPLALPIWKHTACRPSLSLRIPDNKPRTESDSRTSLMSSESHNLWVIEASEMRASKKVTPGNRES